MSKEIYARPVFLGKGGCLVAGRWFLLTRHGEKLEWSSTNYTVIRDPTFCVEVNVRFGRRGKLFTLKCAKSSQQRALLPKDHHHVGFKIVLDGVTPLNKATLKSIGIELP